MFVFIGQFFDGELKVAVLTGEGCVLEGYGLKLGFVFFFGLFKGAFADGVTFTCDGWFAGLRIHGGGCIVRYEVR